MVIHQTLFAAAEGAAMASVRVGKLAARAPPTAGVALRAAIESATAPRPARAAGTIAAHVHPQWTRKSRGMQESWATMLVWAPAGARVAEEVAVLVQWGALSSMQVQPRRSHFQ